MALADLLALTKQRRKIGMSKERALAMIPEARKCISVWRDYPDLFVDFMAQKTNFKLYYYQRIFMRAAIRHKFFYGTFPRAYSKSFLAVMIEMIRCVLYPGAKLFVTSGGKEQSAGIIKEKVTEICTLIPAFRKEIIWDKYYKNDIYGHTIETKDYCKYVFKNGSYFDNVAANEKSRGKRRHGFVGEECVGIDGKILSEVLIPITNISRSIANGDLPVQTETLNKSQCMITTAGYKNTFAYDKLIQFLIWSVVNPAQAIVLGGTWRIPVLVGIYDRDFIKTLQQDGTFNESSFEREYCSVWSGTTDDAYFSADSFDRARTLNLPEYEVSGRNSKHAYYILSMDVGRRGCDSVICVLKVTPQPQGADLKSLVNIFILSDTHFEDQTIFAKKLFYKYNAKRLVIDGNGIGMGLVDFMVKSQIDPDTGDVLPDFGIYNDSDYNRFRTNSTEIDAIYVIKATPGINTEAHGCIQTQFNTGKIKLLIDERVAKAKLLNTKKGQDMTVYERAKYLKPFTLTSMLRDEMLNLQEKSEGVNIRFERINKSIKKDTFSALEYGLYYIKTEEESRKKKKRFRISDMLMMN